ncbi:hypothetical protein LTR36_000754 [Oleoguttula mirabilis]|uniref:Uncharacterized protein n=1 Tax=Oleoguttula mirabilis TaxID=1507867 RepID=A0AAV9JQB0_9PEZI|nr:hypothetical protein LTR36_000754 [Oleoguttula mirabilis]
MDAKVINTDAGEQQEAWEAPQLEEALARLERLQQQLDGLRSSIPSLVTPLLRPNASKAHMFAEVAKSAVQSTDDLKAFRDNWTSGQTQQILARSKESLDGDGDLSKADGVARYGWARD